MGLLLSLLPCGCWDKKVLANLFGSPLLLLTEGPGPWAVAVWRQPLFSTSTPNRPQLRTRHRGKALAGLSLGRRPGMSGQTPCDLFLHGAVPLEARKIWARLA